MATRVVPSLEAECGLFAIMREATDRLHQAPYGLLDVSCQYDQGRLRLRGKVSSFYQKQLAQEALRDLVCIHQIVNDIVVVPYPPR